jgi:Glu-tRNA(Gln) amidotransferase subunit E-like FAD-binding protein
LNGYQNYDIIRKVELKLPEKNSASDKIKSLFGIPKKYRGQKILFEIDQLGDDFIQSFPLKVCVSENLSTILIFLKTHKIKNMELSRIKEALGLFIYRKIQRTHSDQLQSLFYRPKQSPGNSLMSSSNIQRLESYEYCVFLEDVSHLKEEFIFILKNIKIQPQFNI